MALEKILVPDLEGQTDIDVVEIYISVGDNVAIEDPLISLESDKAVMDVPSPLAGTIKEIRISAGDSINTGDLIAMIDAESVSNPDKDKADQPDKTIPPVKEVDQKPKPDMATGKSVKKSDIVPANNQPIGAKAHATPSVRILARELGVDLSRVTASGPKGRITRDDLTGMVKSIMQGGGGNTSGSFTLPPIAQANYADYGKVESIPLSRIKKISGPHLHRNWVGVPHVTQFEDADITELEDFRKDLNAEGSKTGQTKVSPLIFIVKAVVQALKEFPDFNSSLNTDGASITRKHYYNIGIAVDTPDGLVVPVLKNVDSKGIRNLADELADMSVRARDGKLKADEMKGATFTISSLGGIGGTYFTPIVNAPEVAILGLSKSCIAPVWNGKEFEPRLILPLSVSYDHRVIDGAQGARFSVYLASVIGDIRRALL